MSGTDQFQQRAQNGTFSAILKHAARNTDDEQPIPHSDTDDPLERASPTEADDQATGAAVIGIAIAAFVQVQDPDQPVAPVVDKAEPVQDSTGSTLQNMESIPLILQGLSAATPHEDGTLEHELLQDVPAPVEIPPTPLKQPFGDSPLPTLLSDSLTSDQEPSAVTESQEATNPLPALPVNGGVQSSDRPSTVAQLLAMAQEQGTQGTASLGQSLSISVIGESGEGEQDLFGSDAQGDGEGAFFQSGDSGTPDSMTRDNQSLFFNGQFTSAGQTQSSTKGEGSSAMMPEADHLKMAHTLLGEDHSATMTSAYGKAQVVHMELPSHESGPLSVRISMTDQTVHTQFITDRNDLGALLFTRQDQLQQNLTKYGLELGQFQVNVDQRSQQEALPDRQPRRNGEAPDQQQASQNPNQEAQDRGRPAHRNSRVLSLFA